MICILKPYGEIISEPYEIKHTIEELNQISRNYFKF